MGRLNMFHPTQDELTNYEGDKTPKCKCCGKSIWYDNTKVSLRKDGKLAYEYWGTSWRTTKELRDKTYHIQMCQNCLEKHYPEIKEKNKSKLFNTFNKFVKIAFGIPQELIDEKNKLSVPTLENCIRKHGVEKGTEVFEEYKRKQAYSNSFEYKQQKYGWTKEEYDEYNKSRAVTIENLIKRHGEIEGKRIWDEYCERQSYTSTTEYLIKTYGEEAAKNINLLKSRDISGFISRYGEIEGTRLYFEYNNLHRNKNFSKSSLDFFKELCYVLDKNNITFEKIYYGDNEYKMWSNDKKRLYFFDFYIPDINLIIEYNGDYWHCNPQKYKKDYYNELVKMTAEEIWNYDNERKRTIEEEFKIKLNTIWESDVRNNKEQVIEEILNIIKHLVCTNK